MFNVVRCFNVSNGHNAISSSVKLLEDLSNNSLSLRVQTASDRSQKLVVINLSCSILVEELEDLFKFSGTQFVSVFSKAPLELITVKTLVSIVIHSSEDNANASDSVSSSFIQGLSDFVEHCVRRLSGHAKHRIHVRVISTSHFGKER
jgi:hypothetical protein